MEKEKAREGGQVGREAERDRDRNHFQGPEPAGLQVQRTYWDQGLAFSPKMVKTEGNKVPGRQIQSLNLGCGFKMFILKCSNFNRPLKVTQI